LSSIGAEYGGLQNARQSAVADCAEAAGAEGAIARARASGRLFASRRLLRLHDRHLVDRTGPVIGRPFADLLAILEMAGAHAHAPLAEPLPVAGGHTVKGLPPSPNAAILVILYVLHRLGFRYACLQVCAGWVVLRLADGAACWARMAMTLRSLRLAR